MNRLEIVKLASRVGAKVDAPADWTFTLDQLVEFANGIKPEPLDENRLDEYLPAWAYTEMTEGMRKEIVRVIQKQLGVL
jgi:hypothetical protein